MLHFVNQRTSRRICIPHPAGEIVCIFNVPPGNCLLFFHQIFVKRKSFCPVGSGLVFGLERQNKFDGLLGWFWRPPTKTPCHGSSRPRIPNPSRSRRFRMTRRRCNPNCTRTSTWATRRMSPSALCGRPRTNALRRSRYKSMYWRFFCKGIIGNGWTSRGSRKAAQKSQTTPWIPNNTTKTPWCIGCSINRLVDCLIDWFVVPFPGDH